MIIGNKNFGTDHCYVMGILNVTPDSFFDGNNYNTLDNAIRRAIAIQEEGGEIVDVGGESTRPGYTMISDEEEIERVVPVIERIKKEIDIPVSLDTYKSAVAQAGIDAGADLINDIWGLKWDTKMAGVIAKAGVACCLMHNRNDTDYMSFVEDVETDMAECIHLANKAGIADDKIILDPGVGFAKDTAQNLEIIACMDRLNQFGYPVLLGVSRKSVVGNTLNVPKEDRLIGTVALDVIGVMKHANFVRVHDVKEHVQAVKMVEAVMQYM